MTLWLATALMSIVRQSKATTEEASTGQPVASAVHSPSAKQSSRATPLRPAKRSAMAVSEAAKVFTQNTPFCCRTGAAWLRRLRQTRSVGGASETEQTAVAVKPLRPALAAGVV